jgi:hypothetical protein
MSFKDWNLSVGVIQKKYLTEYLTMYIKGLLFVNQSNMFNLYNNTDTPKVMSHKNRFLKLCARGLIERGSNN